MRSLFYKRPFSSEEDMQRYIGHDLKCSLHQSNSCLFALALCLLHLVKFLFSFTYEYHLPTVIIYLRLSFTYGYHLPTVNKCFPKTVFEANACFCDRRANH